MKSALQWISDSPSGRVSAHRKPIGNRSPISHRHPHRLRVALSMAAYQQRTISGNSRRHAILSS